MARTIEIVLDRVYVRENGRLKEGNAVNALVATLIYPSPGNPSVKSIKTFRLRDDRRIDFAAVDPDTGVPYTYADRILFKEDVYGSSELIIEMTKVEKPSTFERFFSKVIGAIFGAAWGAVTGGIGNVILGAVVKTAADAHVESFKIGDDEDEVQSIGRAAVTVPVEGSEAVQQVMLPLTVPEDVEEWTLRLVPGKPEPERKKEKLLRKNEQNGEVTLTVRILDPSPITL